jgi:hypothetical protein
VRFIQNGRNLGFTAAVNQGVRVATGEYLFVLNPDVVLKPNCTQSLVRAFTSEEIGAVAPQLLDSDGSIQMSVRNFPRFSTIVYESTGLARWFPKHSAFGHWRNYAFKHDELKSVEQPMASAIMIRSDVVVEVGEWDERFFVFFSDVDYCKRIVESGFRIVFVPAAQALHQVGGSTRNEGAWLVWDSHRGFGRYLCKHELRGWRVLLRPLACLILWLGAVVRTMMRKIVGRGFLMVT